MLVAAVTTALPPAPAVSEFKAQARLKALPDARVLREEAGLAGRLTVIRSDSLRNAPGLSVAWREAVPPSDAAVIGSDRVVPIERDGAAAPGYRRASLAGLASALRPQAKCSRWVPALGRCRPIWPAPHGSSPMSASYAWRTSPEARIA